ncbi:hypothetical protein, partial [Mycobacterium tuberculosis]|uniref:hypothetical protein n=1 Tax=Mycobacterium tuberculosis TaxID=1773 RepID=UPI001155886E
HAALGHEWDLVVIAGLQDGLWPNTVPRGGVLGTQRLLDELDGVNVTRSSLSHNGSLVLTGARPCHSDGSAPGTPALANRAN